MEFESESSYSLQASNSDSDFSDEEFEIEELIDPDESTDWGDIDDFLEETISACGGQFGNMDLDDVDSDQESLENGSPSLKKDAFQKDLWQMRLFPYAEDMRKNADDYFSYIKTGIARACLHRDTRPGLIYYAHELSKFLQFYGRRFTKRDHINMVELLYSVLITDKLDFSIVQVLANILSQLLGRKNLIKQTEMTLDWRPLYKIYYEISYKNLEEEGVFLLPENLKKSLEKLIHNARVYFPLSATQEILDEIRPLFCPFDDIFSRGLSLAYYFLPTSLTHEQHREYGAGLWFDEFWHWFAVADSPVRGETVFIKIFGKLAKESPFFIDWNDKLDLLFGELLRSFKLNVSADQVSLWSATNVFSTVSPLLVYNFGGERNIVQPHIEKLFLMVKNYLHPSNSGGTHTQNLLTFILLMATEFASRLQRERHNKNRHIIPVPEEYKITDKQADEFVKSVLPCLEFAAYSKSKSEFCPAIFRTLSFLSPGLVIPCVLDLVYPSLETVVEPHRLLQSLNILTGITIQLVRDDPTKTDGERRPLVNFEASSPDSHLKSFRIHAIYLLERLLPAVDLNDAMKTTLSIQIIGLLLILIPISDCSEAVYVRDDLTEEEKELCAASARFDSIIDNLLGRLFNMIDVFGSNPNNTRQNLTKLSKKNIEETVMERGITAVLKTLLKKCSPEIYDKILTFYLDFLQNAMTDSKPVLDTLKSLIPVFILHYPEKAFPVLFDYIHGKLMPLITEEALADEEVESEVIWFLNLFAEVVHEVPGRYLIMRRDKIDALIDLGVRFKCKDAIGIVGRIIQNAVSSLIAFYPQSASFDRRKQTDLTEYLPIRHWAQTIDKQTWNLKWTMPGDTEIDYAQHLVNKIIFQELDRLNNPAAINKLSHIDLQKRLIFIRTTISGASKLMPFLPGKPVRQFSTEPGGLYVDTVFMPKDFRVLTSNDGQNLRLAIYKRLQTLADYILKNRTDDHKAMGEIISILRILLLVRGVDEKSFQPLMNAYRLNKTNLMDPVRGSSANIEAVVEDSLIFMHLKRSVNKPSLSLTETHLDAFRLLIRLATSAYSNVRIQAQRVLDSCFNCWARSYKFVLDEILQHIHKDSNSTHEQLKGALYILAMGKNRSIALRQDFNTLLRIWPTLVNSKYSEKPSIVQLQDSIHDLLIGFFASFEISFNFPDDTVTKKAKILIENYDGCVHSPNYPGFDYLSEEEGRQFEANRNQENIQCYYELINVLTNLCHDKSLHWRHVEMAQSLLSLLLRKDMEFPKNAILIFGRLLASDVIRARKTAINIMSSWLRINKPKAIRQVIDFDKGENQPGAKWPIKYGIRQDNVDLLFKQEDKITSADQWNNTPFHTKPYVGFYIWPKEYKMYAPPSAQANLNRDPSVFTDTEKELVNLLIDPTYLARVLKLMAVEEKKGSEEFSIATYSFFYGLTRSFGTVIVEALRPFVEELLANKQEASQRLASEVCAGIIKGSKLWTYDKAKPLRDWLGPLLIANFETINVEIEGLWAQSLVSIFFDGEPRQTSWLFDLLMELWRKPNENTYHMAVRLYFLHCAVSQWEWRNLELWNAMFEICKPMLGQSLQNLRNRVASITADACQFEYKYMHKIPTLESRFQPAQFKTVSDTVKFKVQKMFANALEGASNSNSGSDTEMIDLTDSKIAPNGELALKKEKLVFLTYLSGLSVYTGCSAEPHVLEFLPILAHYANDTKDEELRNQCSMMLLHVLAIIPVERQHMQVFLRTIVESLNRCSWWKARVTLLRFVQVSVFANIFLLKEYVGDICKLLFLLLKDQQLEVRLSASDTLSGFISCGYIPVADELMNVAYNLSQSEDLLEKHAGVLALASVILAYPYSVPDFIPEVLMKFCRFATAKQQPIHATVKKTLGEFKRTHTDSWHEHKKQFNEEQLSALTDLFTSANYYV